MDHIEELKTLIQKLKCLHPFGALPTKPIPPAVLPSDFASLVTSREPWRAQVLEEARWHFAFPVQHGIGLEVRFSDPPAPAPFAEWEISLSPVEAELVWSQDMSGRSSEGVAYTLQRVVWENDAWKIVELWSERARKSNLAFIEMLNGKAEQPSPRGDKPADPDPDKPLASELPEPARDATADHGPAQPKRFSWSRAGKWLLVLFAIWACTTTPITVKIRSYHSWQVSPQTITEKTSVYWVWPGQSFGSSSGMPMMFFGKPLFRLITPGIWSATISYSEDLSCSSAPGGTGDNRWVAIYREPVSFNTRSKDLGSTIEVSLGGYLW